MFPDFSLQAFFASFASPEGAGPRVAKKNFVLQPASWFHGVMPTTEFSVYRDGRLFRRCSSAADGIRLAEADAMAEFSTRDRRHDYVVSGIDFRREGRLVGEKMAWTDLWSADTR